MDEKQKQLEEMARFLLEEYNRYARGQKRLTSAANWSKELGVNNTSLSQWMNGLRLPSGNNTHRLAKHLGPRVYEITGTPPLMPDDPLLLIFVKLFFAADEQTREEALAVLKGDMNTASE